jgi:hypothetical protein
LPPPKNFYHIVSQFDGVTNFHKTFAWTSGAADRQTQQLKPASLASPALLTGNPPASARQAQMLFRPCKSLP